MSDAEQIYVSFHDGSLSLVEATQLGSNRFRLEHTPLFSDEGDPGFGDVIEVAPLDDTSRSDTGQTEALSYRLVRILERAAYDRFMWVIPLQIAESAELKGFMDAVIQAGGSCERVAGGVLMASLPKGSSFDAEEALDEVFRAVRNFESD